MKKNKWFKRILSGILAVALIVSGLLYRAAQISMDANGWSKEASLLAAKQLLRENGYANSSRLGRMSKYMKQYLRRASTYEDYENVAEIAIANENYQDAIAGTDKSIEAYEGDDAGLGTLYLRKGYLYTLLQDYEAAREMLGKGLELNASPEGYLTRAQICVELGDEQGAKEDLDSYLANVSEEDLEAMLPNLAGLAFYAENYELAARGYLAQTQLLKEKSPSQMQAEGYLVDENASLLSAFCLTKTGQIEEAAKKTDEYIQSSGADIALAQEMMGLAYLERDEWKQAAEAFIKSKDAGNNDPDLLRVILLSAYMSEDYASATVAGEEAIAATDAGTREKESRIINLTLPVVDDETLQFLTGASHIKTGEYEKALKNFGECIEREGCAYLVGTCYLAMEKYDEARELFTESIEKEEEIEKSMYARGICRMEAGDIGGALDDFDYVCLQGEDEDLFQAAGQLILELTAERMTEETTDEE